MLTIKDLLEIKSISGLRIVAGEQGINNIVSLVNIMENPDKFDWLSSNELLLSTGYIFKDNEALQNQIIKELAEINCAGLVIKIKRYFETIPQNMIDQANNYGLPLLELPYEYTLSKVISIFNEKSSGGYDLMNRKALDIHNTLFETVLKGGGIERIATILCETVSNPVLFLDRDWNLLHYIDHGDNTVPLAYALELKKNRPVFHQKFTGSIPKDISEMKKSIKRNYCVEDFEVKCRILPVTVSSYIYGYIVVWQTVQELTDFDYIVLERASSIMALEIIKAKEIEDVKLNIRHDFFDDLLTGKITSSETIRTLCNLHGLNSTYMYYCIVIQIESEEEDKYDDMVTKKFQFDHNVKKCIELIYQHANKASGEISCFHRSNRIIILIGQSNNRAAVSINETKQYAYDVQSILSKQIRNTTFLVGIGRQYNSIHSLHKSFSEANEAIRLMQKFNDKNNIVHFEDHSVYHFLDSNVKDIELDNFFMKCLGKIYEYDTLHGTNYLITLENYFMNNFNTSETAKMMFLHRNTLIYRIEKIKEIMETDLKNSEELFQIHLALKIFRLLNKDTLQ